jgi:MFS transporter, ACS family, tartrate transporter
MQHNAGAAGELEQRVSRKLIVKVGGLLFLLYCCFALDRGNVGFAALEMNRAIGISASIFGLGASLFTLFYLLFQVPNTLLLRRLGPSRGFAVLAIGWGLVSASSALIWNATSFLAMRVLLGCVEAGFHAYLIYYISQVFPRRTRGLAVGLAMTAVPLSQIVAAPLSGALLTFDSGLHGWQWLFIVEGLPAALLGLVCFRGIPDSTRSMRFLAADEREWLAAELAEPLRVSAADHAVSTVPQVIANPLVWGLGFVLFANVLGTNTFLLWMPQLIKEVSGAGNLEVGYLTMLPWAALAAGMLLLARLADRLASTLPILCLGFVLSCVGFALAAAPQMSVSLIGLLLAAFGIGAAQSLIWAFAMRTVTGPAAATAYSLITVIGNGSGVFAHTIIGWARDTTGSFVGVVIAISACMLLAIGVLLAIGRHSRSA